MRGWVLFLQLPLFILLAAYSCRKENTQPVNAQLDAVPVTSDTTKLLDFDQDIVPILKSHCQPCHFPGGKMYEKMPFDQSKTILDHREGVTKRFKNQELEKLKAYLQQAIR
ncbi:MAG TPA: hypothetical protein VFU05_16595 [Cyclobacteriaceae bacterium]|nr:hypothetical protein [Cyclobacteriaceae bacterium]